MASHDEMIEVYRTSDEALAQMAIDEVLEPAGISAVIHDRFSKSFPTPASNTGAFFVAVPQTQAQGAIESLKAAQAEGLLPDGGEVASL